MARWTSGRSSAPPKLTCAATRCTKAANLGQQVSRVSLRNTHYILRPPNYGLCTNTRYVVASSVAPSSDMLRFRIASAISSPLT